MWGILGGLSSKGSPRVLQGLILGIYSCSIRVLRGFLLGGSWLYTNTYIYTHISSYIVNIVISTRRVMSRIDL